MTEDELRKLVANSLKIPVDELNGRINEDWDSLDHLSILVRLDAILAGKVSTIEGIESCFNFSKILNKLKENGIVK